MMARPKKSIPELRILSESNEDLEGASAEPVVDSRAPLLNVPSGCPRRRHSWVYGYV